MMRACLTMAFLLMQSASDGGPQGPQLQLDAYSILELISEANMRCMKKVAETTETGLVEEQFSPRQYDQFHTKQVLTLMVMSRRLYRSMLSR